jgi:putative tricarboxylic transport membrane protein
MPSDPIPHHETRRVWGPFLLAAALIVFGAAGFWFALEIGRTGAGGGHDPGPRFFPMALSLILVSFGGLQFLLAVLGKSVTSPGAGETAEVPLEEAPSAARWLILLAVLVLYVLGMGWIGFSVSTLLMAVGLMVWLGNRWWVAIVVAVVMVAVVRLLFVMLFRVQLPAGEWGLPF